MAIIPIPPAREEAKEFPSFSETRTVVKKMARLGISVAFRWAWTWFQVFRAPKRVWRQGKRYSISGAAEDIAAECIRSFQWKDGQNHT
jgi:hypothetical protein